MLVNSHQPRTLDNKLPQRNKGHIEYYLTSHEQHEFAHLPSRYDGCLLQLTVISI